MNCEWYECMPFTILCFALTVELYAYRILVCITFLFMIDAKLCKYFTITTTTTITLYAFHVHFAAFIYNLANFVYFFFLFLFYVSFDILLWLWTSLIATQATVATKIVFGCKTYFITRLKYRQGKKIYKTTISYNLK